MGILFSKAPATPTLPPPVPTRDDTAARGEQSEARRRAAAAKGRVSTIETIGAGVETDDSNVKKKSLLGGGYTS